uniref:Uncharacterized protein n=1 Tax=Amphimedon queenslandica TaxID=400682 RepID=A0A1X7V6Q2_AMPQE
ASIPGLELLQVELDGVQKLVKVAFLQLKGLLEVVGLQLLVVVAGIARGSGGGGTPCS